MPKGRTNTIARIANDMEGAIGLTGSGMSENIISQLAQRINNGFDEPIQIQMESRSRGRDEIVTIEYQEDSDDFRVNSGPGTDTHRVSIDGDNYSCTCADYRYRGNDCRHIRAVDEAIGQVREDVIELSAADIGRMRIAQDIRDELDRNNEGLSEDDGYFYTDDPEAFDRTFENVEDRMINYEYEDVLNGNNSTFGVELEFVGGNADAIARELYDLGITAAPYRLRYHSTVEDNSKWKLERDGSVSDGSGGGELVSPILKDTPETWRQIEIICTVAQRHGAIVNERCGAHVHVGMNKLEPARQRWRRFFKMVENYEACFFRAAGGDLGRVRDNGYSRSFSERAGLGSRMRFDMDTDEDVRDMARRVSEGNRYYGVNLTNIASGRAPTVEMRYFNGSLNPKQVQANIKLAVGVINAAEKARWRDTEDENFKKRGQILKNTNRSSGTRTKEKMMEFVDLVFTRKKDKDAIINVFKKNNWR